MILCLLSKSEISVSVHSSFEVNFVFLYWCAFCFWFAGRNRVWCVYPSKNEQEINVSKINLPAELIARNHLEADVSLSIFFNWTKKWCLILLCKSFCIFYVWLALLTYFLGMPLQSLNDRGAPLHFILIDGTWSNSKAMVSRLQVCLWILVIFWYWIFEKSLISGTDSQIVTAMSVNQWVWFPFDYLVDHGSLPEEHSPFSWLPKRSSPWVDRWCSKAATNLCRLFFEFVLNHDKNVDFYTCRSVQMLFGKEVACHV